MLEKESEDLINEIKKRIRRELEVASLEVSGGSGHYRIRVVSLDFEGKTSVNRQRMVFSALGDLIMGPSAPIHAVDQMETLTTE